MALDLDWEDKPFISLDDLYRPDPKNIVEADLLVAARPKAFIDIILNSEIFINTVFDASIVSSSAFPRIVIILKNCAKELFSRVLEILDKLVDKDLLYTVAAACVAIAVKLLGAHDWIYDAEVYSGLVRVGLYHRKVISKKLLSLMEMDILKRTDWRACSSVLDLDKIYDEEFKEFAKENELTEEDYDSMMREAVHKWRSMTTFKLIIKDQWYLVSIYGEKLTANDIVGLGIEHLPITVSINGAEFERIAKTKGQNISETKDWILNRVLDYGFGLSNVTLNVVW